MKKLHLFALVGLIMLGLSGCEKEKNTNEAYPDVFVQAIKNTQGETVYSVVHSVFSYSGMKSVSVSLQGGSITQLTNYQNQGFTFYNEPAVTDYLITPPSGGSYSYTVKFNDGEEIVYTNALSSANLPPANITVAKTTKGDSVYIYLDAIPNVDSYGLKVSKGTTEVFPMRYFSDTSNPKKQTMKLGFSLSQLTSGISGIYDFEITGFLLETGTTDYPYLQAKSLSTKNITL